MPATSRSITRPKRRARLSPEQFLRALPQPAILDEIQYAPELFRHFKLAVDRDRRPGRFLVTGLQTLSLITGAGESLAGRNGLLAGLAAHAR